MARSVSVRWFKGGGPRRLSAVAVVATALAGALLGFEPAASGYPAANSIGSTTSSSTSTTTTLPPLPNVPPTVTNGQSAQELLSTALTLTNVGVDDSALSAAVSASQRRLDSDAETAERARAEAETASRQVQSADADARAATDAYNRMQSSVRQAIIYLYTTGSDQLVVNPSAGALLAYAQDYEDSALSPYGILDQRKAVQEDMADSERRAKAAADRERSEAAAAERAQSDEQVQLRRLEAELASVSTSAGAAIAADHVTLADQAGLEVMGSDALQFTPTAPVPSPISTTDVALTWAFAELGKQYQWGATGPDTFDCSGLTQYVWKAAGVSIPRVAADQDAWTIPVPLNDLLPGDLVFFGTHDIHHVGIYIGGGLMINAPHTGTVVQVSSIWWSDLAGFGRVHDPKVPVPPHMLPTLVQPAPTSVVAGAGPVPSQTDAPSGWKPYPGWTTPIRVNGGPAIDFGVPTTTSSPTTTTTVTTPAAVAINPSTTSTLDPVGPLSPTGPDLSSPTGPDSTTTTVGA